MLTFTKNGTKISLIGARPSLDGWWRYWNKRSIQLETYKKSFRELFPSNKKFLTAIFMSHKDFGLFYPKVCFYFLYFSLLSFETNISFQLLVLLFDGKTSPYTGKYYEICWYCQNWKRVLNTIEYLQQITKNILHL